MIKTTILAFGIFICILFPSNPNLLFTFESHGLGVGILNNKNSITLLNYISSFHSNLIENPKINYWSKIIFGLLILNFGLFLAKKRDAIFYNSGIHSASFNVFDKKSFFIYFFMVATLMLLVNSNKLLANDKQLLPFDVLSSFLTTTLLAYLLESLERKSLVC